MVEITEHKLGKMVGHVEEMLRAGGKLMSCLDELEHGGYGERHHDGMVYDRYGHMGMREQEHEDGYWDEMGERRRRRANGRFY